MILLLASHFTKLGLIFFMDKVKKLRNIISTVGYQGLLLSCLNTEALYPKKPQSPRNWIVGPHISKIIPALTPHYPRPSTNILHLQYFYFCLILLIVLSSESQGKDPLIHININLVSKELFALRLRICLGITPNIIIPFRGPRTFQVFFDS